MSEQDPTGYPPRLRTLIASALALSIPVLDGRLALGTWQGIYVWEHRRRGSTREIVLHVGK